MESIAYLGETVPNIPQIRTCCAKEATGSITRPAGTAEYRREGWYTIVPRNAYKKKQSLQAFSKAD
jgi:hypothetical protein